MLLISTEIYWIFIWMVLRVPEGRSPSTNLLGHVEFSDVHFSYPSRPEVAIFSGLDLVVPSGSVTAVVGSSGSGKSTLTALLMRFYDPTSGTVKVGGTNVCEFSPYWLRTHMSIVHQVQALFTSPILRKGRCSLFAASLMLLLNTFVCQITSLFICFLGN